MFIKFTKHDFEVWEAFAELKCVMEADIDGAHGLQGDRPQLSDLAIRLYDEVVKAVEVEAHAQAESAAADQG